MNILWKRKSLLWVVGGLGVLLALLASEWVLFEASVWQAGVGGGASAAVGAGGITRQVVAIVIEGATNTMGATCATGKDIPRQMHCANIVDATAAGGGGVAGEGAVGRR